MTNDINTYTAIGEDSSGDFSTNMVTVILPATNNYTYDVNGNLLSDGTRNFAYDDENELIGACVSNAWSNSFAYDGKMRMRIERDFTWQGGAWSQTSELHFIYDGNVVIEERNASNNPLVSYTRGNDLSGSLQGAGGIGGLLARTHDGEEVPGSTLTNAFYHADGNGNITALMFPNQQLTAKYLYDPYGNTLSVCGPLAEANKYRFSSKRWMDNAGLYYYGYRFYDPNLQSWVNRDPKQERGGKNLYEFAQKTPINDFDPFGLSCPCGPDVTIAVQNVLQEEEDTYNSPTIPTSVKCQACWDLYDPKTAGADWDIYELAWIGLNKNNTGCKRTVFYRGKCVWASALNYILFGKANALCGWNESLMTLAIEEHKFYDLHDFSAEAFASWDFAEEGYTGANPDFFQHGPGNCNTSKVQKSLSLHWHWYPLK